MNAPTLTRRGFTKGLGGLVLAFSLDPAELLAQGASRRGCRAASTTIVCCKPGSGSAATATPRSTPARSSSGRAS